MLESVILVILGSLGGMGHQVREIDRKCSKSTDPIATKNDGGGHELQRCMVDD